MGADAVRVTENDLKVALAAARKAAEVAHEGFNRPLSVKHKGPVDLVTQYDLMAEQMAREVIGLAFPSDTLVCEESGVHNRSEHSESQRTWYIDPLDGTTNFAHGFPLFAASVGLVVEDEPVVGAVVAPALGLEFAALKGGGATLNGRPISVSKIDDLNDALVVTGFPYFRREASEQLARAVSLFISQSQGLRRLGAAALDLCFVACGWLDAQWENGLKGWDLAAGMAIVLEAGGEVTDWSGAPPFRALTTGEVATSNGRVHARLLDILRQIGPIRCDSKI